MKRFIQTIAKHMIRDRSNYELFQQHVSARLIILEQAIKASYQPENEWNNPHAKGKTQKPKPLTNRYIQDRVIEILYKLELITATVYVSTRRGTQSANEASKLTGIMATNRPIGNEQFIANARTNGVEPTLEATLITTDEMYSLIEYYLTMANREIQSAVADCKNATLLKKNMSYILRRIFFNMCTHTLSTMAQRTTQEQASMLSRNLSAIMSSTHSKYGTTKDNPSILTPFYHKK
ncbi:hypothetical protein DAPPUDRAFT_340419 [Daphnia pulex]|uniref:Uncharacterized protein n=1 Tax=Daphnia pulex TaxID=6669 RepID=E9I459_DAPPU|nr:hypothetical protein DAPPUDRAFT_340419 [Daphnia pulex]|eukprot:EFX61221.1 hypothetical protein DAPPUDRAFT_340419 [Daphnia pulex]